MSRTLFHRLPDGREIIAMPDGSLKMRRPVQVWHVAYWSDADRPPTPPLDLRSLPLPDDMTAAIKTLRDAREDELTAGYVQNAVSILMRYVTAADQVAARNAGAPKGAEAEKECPHLNMTAAGKATDDQILQAFSLARDLMSAHPPPLFKTVLLKIEEATGLKSNTWRRDYGLTAKNIKKICRGA